ncbi:MAG TPA: hypothetical protein VL422_14045 [Miltoncostaea sp.]|nr:hypothetical protein [Miltoncostaea sp.]
MSAGGMKPRPTDRRSVLIATVLSLLLPGLGHAYALRLTRALVWFAGVIAVGLVLGQGEENTALAVVMGSVIAVLAALDIALVMWLDGRKRPAG